MLSEEQWQLVGYCEDCGAPLYFKEGQPIKAINPAPSCLCHATIWTGTVEEVEEKEEEK